MSAPDTVTQSPSMPLSARIVADLQQFDVAPILGVDDLETYVHDLMHFLLRTLREEFPACAGVIMFSGTEGSKLVKLSFADVGDVKELRAAVTAGAAATHARTVAYFATTYLEVADESPRSSLAGAYAAVTLVDGKEYRTYLAALTMQGSPTLVRRLTRDEELPLAIVQALTTSRLDDDGVDALFQRYFRREGAYARDVFALIAICLEGTAQQRAAAKRQLELRPPNERAAIAATLHRMETGLGQAAARAAELAVGPDALYGGNRYR